MSEQTGGEAVVEVLRAIGMRHVFGIVSVHNLPIFDAIGQAPDIELVPMRHEQAVVHAADGYARATGGIGVGITSTGPGAANAMGGLFEAAYASSPVLTITGQVETAYFGKGRGYLHEAERQREMLATVARTARTVRRRQDLVPTISNVVYDMCSGRPMPAAVEIPIDIQSARFDDPPFSVTTPAPTPPDPTAVAQAAGLLANAARPLLWAGGGVMWSGAADELRALAEFLDAPVLTTIEGRGAIPEDHPLALGPNSDMTVLDDIIADADVVLAVGTRFQMATPVHRALTIPGALIHLDADPSVIGRNHRTRVAMVADARVGLQAITKALTSNAAADSDYRVRARAAAAAAVSEARDSAGPDYVRILDAIRAGLPRDGIVVKDATISAYVWANRALAVYEPRTSLRPTSMAIGPGLPLGIGAAIGSGRPTVVIHGDGGLMLSVGELASLAQQQAPVTVCVFNDGGYGILRFIQDNGYAGRHTGVDLTTPDFAVLARAMGVESAAVDSAEEFERVFPKAVSSGVPWLLDIDVSRLAPLEIRSQRLSSR
jgi:acetolactate synthase-1/2/3 large subunit